ncbi:transcription intermediary factor 1-alpha-like isoform X3 [Dysidea avara]|uniref:transcription intermediary factor 1-alpha-like isoform X3 n=1 Tax=Dysidea avara TaxID=196820 RepID=UPI00331D5425
MRWQLSKKIEQNKSIPCNACIKGELATSFCFDCSDFQFHCKECFECHKYSTEKQGHRIIQPEEIQSKKKDVTLKQKSMQCQYHELDLMFYCETHDELACSYCNGKKYTGHEHESVKMMAKKHRSKIDDIIKPMDNIIVKLTKAQQNISSTREKIHSQATELEQEIDTYFDQLEQKLKQQRANLKKELHEVSTEKEKAVSLQLKQLENIQVQLENVKELSEAVKNGSDHEALFMNKQLAKDVEKLSTICTKLSTEPVELANTKFSKEYEESFPFFGNLSYGDISVFNTLIAYDVPAYGQVGK